MAPIFVVPFLSSLKNYIQELRFLFKIILGKKKKSLLKNIFLTMPLVKQNKQTKKKENLFNTYLMY